MTLGLGGCGIRLEDDAPHVPLVPTRTPIPGEADLLALLRGTRDLAGRLRGAGVDQAAELAGWHDRQAVVLDAALRRAGVPADAIDPAPTPSGSTGSTTGSTGSTTGSAGSTTASASSTPAPAGTAALVRAEQDAVAAVGTLLGIADPGLLTMLSSMRASRLLACRILGRDPGPPTAGVAGADAPEPERVVPFLTASREAAYGLEVVAAQASGARRDRTRAWLAQVRALALAQEQAAGASAPPAASAYELPLSPDEADGADRLAQYLLAALPGAYGDAIGAAARATDGRQPDRALVALGSDWLARATGLAADSGTDSGAFPGLR